MKAALARLWALITALWRRPHENYSAEMLLPHVRPRRRRVAGARMGGRGWWAEVIAGRFAQRRTRHGRWKWERRGAR